MGRAADPLKLPKRFKSPILKNILLDSLSDAELAALAKRLGVEFPGFRLDRVPPFELAAAIEDRALDRDPEACRLVCEYLDTACAAQSARLESLEYPDIAKRLLEQSLFGADEIGQFLWALGWDERPEVGALARKLLADLRSGRGFDLLPPEPDGKAAKAKSASRPGPRTLPTRLQDRLDQIQRAAEAMAREVEKIASEHDRCAPRTQSLESSIEGLKADLAERDRRLEARKASIERLERQVVDLGSQVEGLNQKLTTAGNVGAILKENRKLQHEVASLRLKLQAKPDPAEFERRLAEAKAELEHERAAAQEARARLAEIERRLENPPPRLAAVAREESLASLVVDAEGLFFASRRRNCRVDYRALLRRATGGLRLSKAVAFAAEFPTEENALFRRRLLEMGFLLRAIPRGAGGSARAWTADLAREVLEASARCGQVTVACADPGIAETLRQAREGGCRVVVAGFEPDLPPQLRQAASQVMPLEGDLLLPGRPPGA